MARQARKVRRAARTRSAGSGFTLLEIAFTLGILVIAIASTSATTISLSALRRANRERSVAHNAAAALAERIHSIAHTVAAQPGAWAQNLCDTACQPNARSASFDVPELQPQDGQTHVGTVAFVLDETRTDVSLGVELGMPHDLDGDGLTDKTDAIATARLVPVVIEVRWKGVRGNQRILHPFFVSAY